MTRQATHNLLRAQSSSTSKVSSAPFGHDGPPVWPSLIGQLAGREQQPPPGRLTRQRSSAAFGSVLHDERGRAVERRRRDHERSRE